VSVTNAGTPERRLGRGAEKELMAMEAYKNKKTRFQLYLFLFSSNDGLKNNDKHCRKPC